MENDYKILVGLLLGIVAYCLLYLAKGIEKCAIEGIKEVKTIKSKHSGVWVFGVLLNAAYMFLQWAALNYAPVNLIAPLNGIGLIALLVFSYYVLHERITQKELFGVVLIVLGTAASSLFNPNYNSINQNDFNFTLYLTFLISVITFEVLLVFLTSLFNYKGTGIIIGLTAGTFFAFETVSKRITSIPNNNIRIIFTIITMIISCTGFIFTQVALVKSSANTAVPCFTSTSVVFAAITGMLFLHEGFNLGSILGIVLIVIGIILLTAFKENKNHNSNKISLGGFDNEFPRKNDGKYVG